MTRKWWSAIERGDADAVSHLLNKHPKYLHAINLYKEDGLNKAIEYGQVEIARILISAGADVNSISELGSTLLMNAAAKVNPTGLQLLLQAGAAVNMVDRENWSALIYACFGGYAVSIKMLLEAGADKHVQTIDGWNALQIVSEQNHTNCIKLLLDEDMNINDLFQTNSDLSMIFGDPEIQAKTENRLHELSPENLMCWKKHRIQRLFC